MPGLSNDEHAELAEWADEIARRRRPQGTPNCPFCKLWRGEDVEMLFRHGNIHTDPIAWGQNRKCPECFHIEAFGLPMTEDEYQRTHDLQKGRHYNGKPVEDVQTGELGEQLEALGYLSM